MQKGREGSDEANKASGVTTVANGSPARGDIGIESVYARQVPERDRDTGKERTGYDGGKRVRAGETEQTGREGKSESEMARGQPDLTLCQFSDLLVRRHEEALFTTKSLVDNAG